MPLREISEYWLGTIQTTKLLAITSGQTVWRMESGNRAAELINVGSFPVFYGQSGVLIDSGGMLTMFGAKFWDHVVNPFSLALQVASGGVTSVVVVHEYGGT